MSIEDIRTYRNAEPFAPFEIVLSDGRVVPVARRERIAIAPWGKVHVFVQSSPNLFDVDQVSAIRPAAEAAA